MRNEVKAVLENVACLGRDAHTVLPGHQKSYIEKMTDYIMYLVEQEKK